MSTPNLNEVFARISGEQYGFVTATDAADIRSCLPDPQLQVLVRCGRDRFMCSLGELEFRMASVERDGDYVRDVSVPNNPRPLDWQRLGYQPPGLTRGAPVI